MDETLYKIEFEGELSEGYSEEGVKIELRNRFKLEEKKIDRMFSGDPLILKKGIGKQKAEKFARTFLDIGVVCKLVPLPAGNGSIAFDPPPPVEKEDSSSTPTIPEPQEAEEEDEILPLLNVREVLGFSGRGLRNPESEIQLYESESTMPEAEKYSTETVEFPGESAELMEHQPELLEVEKSSGPEEDIIPLEEVNDHQEPRFRIVFSGEIADGQSKQHLKQAIADLLGIEVQDTHILFSNVPVVL